MNLGQARSLVRMYVNEPKSQTWTDAQLNGIIQEANREIYARIVALCPQWFAGAGQFTWPANTSRLFLPTTTSLPVTAPPKTLGNILRILGLFVVRAEGDLGTQNVPIPMRSVNDIPSLYNTPAMMMAGTTPSATNAAYSATPVYAYCMLGPWAYIWPVPTQATVVTIFGIPTVATPTADADNLLTPGDLTITAQLTDFHELIPLLAAIKVKSSVGDPDNGLSSVYKSQLDSTERVLAIGQSIQQPAQVRGVNI